MPPPGHDASDHLTHRGLSDGVRFDEMLSGGDDAFRRELTKSVVVVVVGVAASAVVVEGTAVHCDAGPVDVSLVVDRMTASVGVTVCLVVEGTAGAAVHGAPRSVVGGRSRAQ